MNGSPAVEGVFRLQLRSVTGALQEQQQRAERAHVSVPAGAVQREARAQHLVVRKPQLDAHRHASVTNNAFLTGIKYYYLSVFSRAGRRGACAAQTTKDKSTT